MRTAGASREYWFWGITCGEGRGGRHMRLVYGRQLMLGRGLSSQAGVADAGCVNYGLAPGGGYCGTRGAKVCWSEANVMVCRPSFVQWTLEVLMEDRRPLVVEVAPGGVDGDASIGDEDGVNLKVMSRDSVKKGVEGPEGTMYSKGDFSVKIQIPERYPFNHQM